MRVVSCYQPGREIKRWGYMRQKIQPEGGGKKPCATVVLGINSNVEIQYFPGSFCADPAGKNENRLQTARRPAGYCFFVQKGRAIEWRKRFNMSGISILIVRGYQLTISPWLPRSCRFEPSCSQYAIDAFRIHGFFMGLALTVWRLLRCQPFCKGGFDPVPARKREND